MLFRRICLAASIFSIAACAPELNWREVQLPKAYPVQVLFPCKPHELTRSVALNAATLSMSLYSCQAGGATFALAVADAGSVQSAATVLEGWKKSQADNLAAQIKPRATEASLLKPGHANADRRFLKGQLPDGSTMAQEVFAFSKGSAVFQATVMAPQVNADAALFFFEGLR